VLRQCGIKYTIIPPFTADPGEAVFKEHIEAFAGICRVAAGMKRTNIGSIGARTPAFKTVRVDEIGLQNHKAKSSGRSGKPFPITWDMRYILFFRRGTLLLNTKETLLPYGLVEQRGPVVFPNI
jgi:hypothetical protein